MKKSLLFAGVIISFSLSLVAQEYKTAIGIRLGPNSAAIAPGITVKHFLNEKHALEAMIGFKDGMGVCVMYEWQHPIATVEHLQWFVGAGGYAAFRNSNSYIGGAGIVGLDYKFADIPINISIDWKPELNIIETIGFEASGVGFSLRFTF